MSIVQPLFIEGSFHLIAPPFSDHRGSFFNLFRKADSPFDVIWGQRIIHQINLSHNSQIGTVRGLHLQSSPFLEAKLVRCLSGRVLDVIVDLRHESATYGQWASVELSASDSNAVFIPEGCAHGFQVLESDTQIFYIHSGPYAKNAETGVRFDDPQLAIEWPLKPTGLSERDLALPLLKSFI